MKKYIFIFSIFVICACNDKQNPETEHDEHSTTPSTTPNDVILPEPSVEEKALARFKLTQLAAVTEKFFKINDNIVFTGLDEQIKSKQSLKDVQLQVKSHCIINKNTVLIQEFTRSLSQSIPIIELLPIEVLSQITDIPSCGFSFKAEHKEGSAHHFEIPPLPIVDYTESRFIQLTYSFPDNIFPYIKLEHITHYSIDTGEKEPMDHLKLICDNFSLTRALRPQQFLPLSVFPVSDLTEEQLLQQCRIFGYRNNTLVGVSVVFHIVYPQPSPLYLSIKNDVLSDAEKSNFYYKIQDIDGSDRNSRPDTPIYSYHIHNPYSYPVHILMEDYKERELSYHLYGLYYSTETHQSFYKVHEAVLHLSNIETENGQVTYKQTDQGTLITMGPDSSINAHVYLQESFRLCDGKLFKILWLGGVVRYPDFKVYQLISDKIDLIPLEKNIQYQLENDVGTIFPLLPENLIEAFRRSQNPIEYLWFRQGLCDGGVTADTSDPIIELYKNTPRVRLIDFTPVQQHQYEQTDAIIRLNFLDR